MELLYLTAILFIYSFLGHITHKWLVWGVKESKRYKGRYDLSDYQMDKFEQEVGACVLLAAVWPLVAIFCVINLIFFKLPKKLTNLVTPK